MQYPFWILQVRLKNYFVNEHTIEILIYVQRSPVSEKQTNKKKYSFICDGDYAVPEGTTIHGF